MQINAHGGGCCGVRHISGMDHGTEQELDELLAQVCPNDNPNRLTEIILSSRQIATLPDRRNPERGWPAILNERGFRLVSRFTNSNSDNECFIFHHVPEFLSLDPADMPRRMREWTHGVDYTPPVVEQRTQPRVEMPVRNNITNPTEYTVGRRVRRISRDGGGNSLENPVGSTGTIERVAAPDVNGTLISVRFDHNNQAVRAYTHRFELIPEENPEPVLEETPRVLLSTYHNVYRRSGRSSWGWDSYAQAESSGEVTVVRVDRRDVMSDGEIVWTENVQD